jgi:hypothetical protein
MGQEQTSRRTLDCEEEGDMASGRGTSGGGGVVIEKGEMSNEITSFELSTNYPLSSI